MKAVRVKVSAAELVASTSPHFDWRCVGCYRSLRREATGTAPRCETCGDWCAPVHHDPGDEDRSERKWLIRYAPWETLKWLEELECMKCLDGEYKKALPYECGRES